MADSPVERNAIFDIHCKASSGESFIVEMQKAKIKYFKDRALFYVSSPIREQAVKGDWIFKLAPIYFVAILDFEYDEEEERRKFRRDVALKDQDGDLFFDKLHFKFLQMPLFNKRENELVSKFDKWCYFLKNLENLDHIPTILNEPIFTKAFEEAALANMTATERDDYEQSLIHYRDLKSVVETAVEEAVEKAVEKAVEDTLITSAKNGISKGYDNKTIADLTGFPIEQIEKLRQENK